MQYCTLRACSCKIRTAIMFSVCVNPRARVFRASGHLTCSCMQYCMLHARNCKFETAIVFGMLENPLVQKISSFRTQKSIWPRGAREVHEIFTPWPISPRTLGQTPKNDTPFDSSRRALHLFKRELSNPTPKCTTYGLGSKVTHRPGPT